MELSYDPIWDESGELRRGCTVREVLAWLTRFGGRTAGEPVMINGVDPEPKEINKGIVFQVTDQELLDKTGGIIQGMSGSPILQDGKLVGAVTHVFVNDPTKGYGIFAETMAREAR